MTYTVDAMSHGPLWARGFDPSNARRTFTRYDDAFNYFKALIYRGAGFVEMTDQNGKPVEQYDEFIPTDPATGLLVQDCADHDR